MFFTKIKNDLQMKWPSRVTVEAEPWKHLQPSTYAEGEPLDWAKRQTFEWLAKESRSRGSVRRGVTCVYLWPLYGLLYTFFFCIMSFSYEIKPFLTINSVYVCRWLYYASFMQVVDNFTCSGWHYVVVDNNYWSSMLSSNDYLLFNMHALTQETYSGLILWLGPDVIDSAAP